MSAQVAGIDVDALLAPVAGAAPAGADLRYQPIYDEIKTARRAAELEPNERAPWRQVAGLAAGAIAKSKDLQLAIWLLEAISRTDGYVGAGSGLAVTRRMLAEYWDSMYPHVDPEDSEPLGFRRALLDWIDEKLPPILAGAPLMGPPYFGLVHYEVTQKTGDEKKALLEEGWPSYERFDEALQASTTELLESILVDIAACETELAALQTTVDERFNASGSGTEPPTFSRIKESLSTARWLVERPLKKRRQESGADGAASGEPHAIGAAAAAAGSNGDQVWAEALTHIRGSRVDGLRLIQTQVAGATSGRDRFLAQLQLAELSLEAGVYSLAYPVFDELARTVDARQLEEWEDKAVIARVFKGLARASALLKGQSAASAAREAEALDRLARLGSTP